MCCRIYVEELGDFEPAGFELADLASSGTDCREFNVNLPPGTEASAVFLPTLERDYSRPTRFTRFKYLFEAETDMVLSEDSEAQPLDSN